MSERSNRIEGLSQRVAALVDAENLPALTERLEVLDAQIGSPGFGMMWTKRPVSTRSGLVSLSD